MYFRKIHTHAPRSHGSSCYLNTPSLLLPQGLCFCFSPSIWYSLPPDIPMAHPLTSRRPLFTDHLCDENSQYPFKTSTLPTPSFLPSFSSNSTHAMSFLHVQPFNFVTDAPPPTANTSSRRVGGFVHLFSAISPIPDTQTLSE